MQDNCPICNEGPMVLRVRKSDNHEFYGCKNFPKCKGTMRSDKYVTDWEEVLYEDYIRDMGDR